MANIFQISLESKSAYEILLETKLNKKYTIPQQQHEVNKTNGFALRDLRKYRWRGPLRFFEQKGNMKKDNCFSFCNLFFMIKTSYRSEGLTFAIIFFKKKKHITCENVFLQPAYE